MNRIFVSAVGVLFACTSAARADLSFAATMTGGAERPVANASTAHGDAVGTLSGSAGSYVFTYHIDYFGITGTSINGAHIHQTSPGIDPINEFGGIIHPLDNSSGLPVPDGTIAGDWRFDDASNPLTDARAQALINGLDYFNIHSLPSFGGGEIRGQIGVVPEPSSLSLLGLGSVTLLARRRRSN
jgi:hypothetical protein